jgi:preprotein translocase subunit YajC
VAGFVLGRLAGYAIGFLLDAIDRRTARIATTDRSVVTPGLISFSRGFVFWLVQALAILLALRILGAGNVSTLLSRVIDFIPQLLIAFTIIVAGHLLGLIARQVMVRVAPGISEESLAPRLAYGVILTVAIVMGLQHLSVDISFVTQLLLIIFAIVGSGLMLAFALGARQHVANLLARREMSRLAVGDHIVIDGIDGSIVDIHATAIDIATAEGIATVPAARFAEATIVRKTGETDGK